MEKYNDLNETRKRFAKSVHEQADHIGEFIHELRSAGYTRPDAKALWEDLEDGAAKEAAEEDDGFEKRRRNPDNNTSDAAEKAFTDPVPISEDPVDMVADLASDGDADAAAKLVGDVRESEKSLSKTIKDADEEPPAWAVGLIEAVEQNTKAIERQSRKEKDGTPFTR